MPSSVLPGVLPIRGCRQGTYVLLDAVLPQRAPCPIGVLLIDLDTGRPWFRMRRDFAGIADPEDAEVFEALEDHIRQCLAESGAETFLGSLEDTLSNALRVSQREKASTETASIASTSRIRRYSASAPTCPCSACAPRPVV